MKKYTIKDLENAFEDAMKQMISGVDEFPWNSEQAYAHWLGQTYYMVRHTTRFLNLSAGKASLQQEDFHQFFLSHLREETGHEMLAYHDMEDIGWKIENVPETMEVQLMIQSQYHWIAQSPFAHFGFFWCLEKLSVERGNKIIEQVVKSHGPTCISFLELHSAEDIGHVKNIYEKVQDIPPEQYENLIRNIQQTGFLYGKMCRELAVKYGAKSKAA